jgi:DNA-directed RNA polymerase specialized sigma24 family protein
MNDPNMEPVKELVVRAQAGDLEAFGRLVDATQTMVYAVSFSVLRDSTAAEDVAQQAYLRAFRRLKDLQDRPRLRGGCVG